MSVLITNRQSHTGFRTDIGNLERRNSPYFVLFHRIRQLCRLITSQWLKIDLSANYRLPVIVGQNWPTQHGSSRTVSATA